MIKVYRAGFGDLWSRIHRLRNDAPAWQLCRTLFVITTIALSAIQQSASLAADSSAADGSAADSVPAAAEPATAAAVYGEGVRSTDWLTPQQELTGFHLPAGFEARLFASEPQIAKPLNLAFDGAGRVWMTQSTTYPYPAENGKSSGDAVMVLEDADGDGHADQVTKFAGDLNIPIGVLPYKNGCLCFSIPNILSLQDTTGDGRCDQRTVILGPFDTTRDTHGMVNSMRDGGDGWIYACHGFNNQSKVAGSDGHEVSLTSGNTFRFRPDGSRIEQITQGQVNPFGITEDDWGYRYSADCHSKPITQLIAGACYPSFGRPHDGLGFLPPMVDHLHGSTAICGIQYVGQGSPIGPLRGQMISGNVMTSRINRNRVEYVGATARGSEQPDFMTSDDPWFRPVDIRSGPDGHLYVADFYNKVIGHYEVPLAHPGRDRTSGRLWQIRYTGNANPGVVDSRKLTVANYRRQVMLLSDGSLDRAAQLIDRTDVKFQVALLQILSSGTLLQAVNDSNSRSLSQWTTRMLRSENPHVRRAAAEALGATGASESVWDLLSALRETSVPDSSSQDSDVVLRQSIRIAIRRLLVSSADDDSVWTRVDETFRRKTGDAKPLADLLLSVKSARSAAGLIGYLDESPDTENARAMLMHALQFAASEVSPDVIKVAQRVAGDSSADRLQVLRLIGPHASTVPQAIRWAGEEVQQRLDAFDAAIRSSSSFVSWSAQDGSVWGRQPRECETGVMNELYSSHTLGESYTGTWMSSPFAKPAEMSFRLAGHNGHPSDQSHDQNRVVLVDAATGAVLRTALPPRHDRAQEIFWDLSDCQAQRVRIEVRDGDAGSAYAWLAAGQFNPVWIDRHADQVRFAEACELIELFRLRGFRQDLDQIAGNSGISAALRISAAVTLARLSRSVETALVLTAHQTAGVPPAMIESALQARAETASMFEPLGAVVSRMTAKRQVGFCADWVRSGGDPDWLLRLCDLGTLSPTAIGDVNVRPAIQAKMTDQQQAVYDRLIANIGSRDTLEILQRISDEIATKTGNAISGAGVFKSNCAACHQLRGAGAVVGPQLDGAVVRPRARLIEDVFAPHLNVDKAFRSEILLMDDGRVLVGVVQSETDTEIRIADAKGKIQTLGVDAVEARRTSQESIMPGNFAETLSDQQIVDLMQFLKSP